VRELAQEKGIMGKEKEVKNKGGKVNHG